MIKNGLNSLLLLSVISFLSACVEESSSTEVITPTTTIMLNSDAGDYIGQGNNFVYTNADTVITVNATGGRLTVSTNGDESWNATFQLPDTYSELQPGSYGNLTRYPFHDAAVGGLSWSGEGRGCNTLTGWIIIDKVTYVEGELTEIELQFEQHCEGGVAALHGEIKWYAADTATAPGPMIPLPVGLWDPAPEPLPVSGSYIYLESELGDYIGAGANYLYTNADAVITVNATDNRVTVSVDGWVDGWNATFQGMNSIAQLEPGYYGDLQRYPFHNPVKGGLSWSGNGRGCNTLSGWFVVDSITYIGSTLSAIDLRFEQHCEDGAAALHGKIKWYAADTTTPPGPVTPLPAGLWDPAPEPLPVSGNYIYLESEPGDYIGAGNNYLYTNADAIITVDATSGRLTINTNGDETWNGTFQGMNSITQLEPGYYGDLERYPFHNPAKGGLSWSGNGRGCNTLSGWFVVDSVTYIGSTLSAIDLRFEQHCGGGAAALHGKIKWSVDDTTTPPGPVTPLPAGLWEPAPEPLPVSGNYVYLESEPGDYIGQGSNYLYTEPTDTITVNSSSGRATVSVGGWNATFQGMNSIAYLEPGYYGDLERYPFHNPTKGGLSWSGNGRGCNTLSGWFVVDSVTYIGVTLSSIDLRFEQHCEGGAPALHGKIHWSQ